MKYKVGMFGGSFDPLHQGHLMMMVQAASQCEELYIVLSYSRKRDYVPMEQRYRWIKNSLSHLSNIQIVCLEDEACEKEQYDDAEWKKGRDQVLNAIGKPVDVVFCGTDYAGSNRYENLYQCHVEYISRDIIPISSTKIRGHELEYWEYLPEVVRSYFVKKVLVIGTESTGKSTLVKNLALHYQTNCVEEVGRDVCAYAGGEEYMIAEDFQEIMLRHKVAELDAIKKSNRLLFVDTDVLTTRYYSQFLLCEDEEQTRITQKKIFDLGDAIAALNHFDLILFLEPGTPFVQDGTRNEDIGQEPEKYARMIKALFDERHLAYECISGDFKERLEQAIKRIDALLG